MAYAWLLGVAHCSSEDDEYNGYFIPANTAIVVDMAIIFFVYRSVNAMN